MRRHLIAYALILVAACGGSKSGNNPDGNNGDGNGNGDSLSGNPTTVTVTLVDHPTDAATYTFLAAYQDGAAAWTAAPAPTGDTYTFTINAPVWGFAWTCIDPTTMVSRVELAYFTVAEKTSLTETVPAGCTAPVTNVGLGGGVTNLPNTGVFVADVYTRTRAVTKGAANGNGTFATEVPAGAHDLFIAEATITTTAADVTAVAAVRGVNAPTTTAAVDWSTNKAVTSQTVTFPTGTMNATASTTLYTSNGTQMTLVAHGNTPFTTVGLDSSQAASGDVYQQSMVVRGNGSITTVENWTSTIGAQTYTAPAPLGGATSSVPGTTPYPEIMTSWNAYTGATGYAWDARQGGGIGTGSAAAPTVAWTTIFGPGYLGASPKFQMPDLSMLAGWSTKLQFATGQIVNGTTTALESTAGATDFPPAQPGPAGTTRTTVSSSWTVTP